MGAKLIGRIIILTLLLIVDLVLLKIYAWPPYIFIGVVLAIFIVENIMSYISWARRMRHSFEQLQEKLDRQDNKNV